VNVVELKSVLLRFVDLSFLTKRIPRLHRDTRRFLIERRRRKNARTKMRRREEEMKKREKEKVRRVHIGRN